MYSLGGGCYVAWALEAAKLKKETQFFDFMWNLQGGLKTVVSIFKDNFESFLEAGNYKYTRDHQILNWDAFNINSRYPELVLMHYDTRDDAVFQSVCRKALRTREIFADNSFKVFLYYRGYYAGPKTVQLLAEESEHFEREFSRKYNSNFVLVSLVEIPKEEAIKGPDIVAPLKNSDRIVYDFVVREDQDHWKQIALKYKNMYNI